MATASRQNRESESIEIKSRDVKWDTQTESEIEQQFIAFEWLSHWKKGNKRESISA